MKKKTAVALLLMILFAASTLHSSEPLTVAEKTDYTRTSLYVDVMDFIYEVQRSSDFVRIVSLCTSTEGRTVPMVILSSEGTGSTYELSATGKPVVLIQANIHAGEIEGKEACLMLIRDIACGKLAALLENQVILVVPNLNADGNEKLAEGNRRDNGPKLAGRRANGQNLDLNRDYPKLETPEISALIGIFNTWDPVLVVDMHTKNGSFHRAPVTYSTCLHPDAAPEVCDYMWDRLFPEVEKTMRKEHGYDAMPYGNFMDRQNPEAGWRNGAVSARYGSNYVGLRNRFSILNENYPHAEFKTRVLASYAFIQSILKYTNRNIDEMRQIVNAADRETARKFHKSELMLEYKIEKLFDLTVKSYRMIIEKIPEEDLSRYPSWWNGVVVRNTGEPKDYRVPYYSRAVPVRSVALPEGYIILPNNDEIIDMLVRHGIVVRRIANEITAPVENFRIEEIKPANNIFQGHVFTIAAGRYEKTEVTIPSGAYYVSLRQPLARVAAFLLEPESEDGFLRWGFFNRVAVLQWGSNRPGSYPVYRVNGLDGDLDLIGVSAR